MESMLSKALVARSFTDAAITVARQHGIPYPSDTYVDLLWEAALTLDKFTNEYKKAHQLDATPPAGDAP